MGRSYSPWPASYQGPPKAENLGGDDAGHGRHRPARVHLLGLDVVLEALGVSAETEGVEAEVTGEGAVEVRGGDGGVAEPAVARRSGGKGAI